MSFTEQKDDTLNIKWRLLNKNMNHWIKNEFTEQKYDTLNTRLLNKNRNYWTKIWITEYKLYVVKYCNNPATIVGEVGEKVF